MSIKDKLKDNRAIILCVLFIISVLFIIASAISTEVVPDKPNADTVVNIDKVAQYCALKEDIIQNKARMDNLLPSCHGNADC